MRDLGYAIAVSVWPPTVWLAWRSGYLFWPLHSRRFDAMVARSERIARQDLVLAFACGIVGTVVGLAIVASAG